MKALTNLSAVVSSLLFAYLAGGQEVVPILEKLPDDVQRRLDLRVEVLEPEFQPQAAGQRGTFWVPGSCIVVAFESGPRGGTEELCREIANVASQWTEHGNIKWSFFDDAGNVRRWSGADTEYQADVRVSFDGVGHWSIVGVDSRDPFVCPPSSASLSLQGFDKSRGADWKYLVLHEFGHALGFIHEHQRPDKPCDYLFKDEPGYKPTYIGGAPVPDMNGKRPGAYRTLGGFPNYWKEEVVDGQLKKLQIGESNLIGTEFDPRSVMKYYFPCRLYEKECESPCCGGGCTDPAAAQVPSELSELDKKAVSIAYPVDAAAIKQRLEEKETRDAALQKAREILDVKS